MANLPYINAVDMRMHILLTVLHTFLMELVRRIRLNIKTSHPILSDHILYSCHLNVRKSSGNVKRNFIFIIVRGQRLKKTSLYQTVFLSLSEVLPLVEFVLEDGIR